VIRETGVAIRDILKMESMKNCHILAGEDGLNKIITQVNVMADPDILNWVDRGEFLLTTAYFFKTSDLTTQLNLIRESSKKKLSGIGIKVYPYLDKLPDEVIDIANELGFPIIELDYNVPFTDIMTPVFKEIFDRQSSIIRKVETLHKDNMKVVLKGGGIEDILGNLSKSIENPILVKDHHFEECIHIGESGDALYKVLVEDINQSLRKSKSALKMNKSSKDQVIVNGKSIDRLMVPIIVRNNVYGHLITYGVWRELTNFDVLSLESTSNVIAMEFLKRISVQEVENKYKAEFFEDLISLDSKRKEKALERANYYRFDKDGHYSILTVLFESPEDEKPDDDVYNQALIKAMYMIDLACRDGSRTYLMANKGRKIHILFMWKNRDEHAKNVSATAGTIENILNTKMNTLSFRIGIGRVYRGLENTYKSLRDAEKAVEASVNFVEDKIIDFDGLGIYKIFCQDHLKEELISFYEATLKPLVLYDRKRDTELVKSLVIYFETNGNLKKMSEKLFTHYNTVLYRINRIQEITGKNLDDEGERYGLQTALKIMKILDL